MEIYYFTFLVDTNTLNRKLNARARSHWIGWLKPVQKKKKIADRRDHRYDMAKKKKQNKKSESKQFTFLRYLLYLMYKCHMYVCKMKHVVYIYTYYIHKTYIIEKQSQTGVWSFLTFTCPFLKNTILFEICLKNTRTVLIFP